MDTFYLTMAHKLAKSSYCQRRKVGAVLVTANNLHTIKAVNNPLPYYTICQEKGCLREENNIVSGTKHNSCRCIHCETSLIVQCAQKGISTLNATVYTTLFPCSSCAKVLIAAGIKRIVYSYPYSDTYAEKIFAQANIQVEQLSINI